jgi:Alpha-N-acetylglucosaminidase (NAGLU) C-terminal domain
MCRSDYPCDDPTDEDNCRNQGAEADHAENHEKRVAHWFIRQRKGRVQSLRDSSRAGNISYDLVDIARQPWASTPDELERLRFDARSLLTTWGDRKASDGASLHDYGNKDWSGLTGDYYKARWQAHFNALKQQLRTGTPAAPIDWFTLGERWNRSTGTYASVPSGDSRQIALQIALEVER